MRFQIAIRERDKSIRKAYQAGAPDGEGFPHAGEGVADGCNPNIYLEGWLKGEKSTLRNLVYESLGV